MALLRLKKPKLFDPLAAALAGLHAFPTLNPVKGTWDVKSPVGDHVPFTGSPHGGFYVP